MTTVAPLPPLADSGEGRELWELAWAVSSPAVLMVALALAVIVAVVVALAGWVAWRRVRVAVAPRARAQRARLERGALAWNAARLPHGPHRQAVELRRSLHDNLAHTRRALDNLPGGTPDSLVELLAGLATSAADLDRRLRIVQDEPVTDHIFQQLPALTEQVAAVNADALALRRAATDLADPGSMWRQDQQDLHDRIHGLAHAARELRNPTASEPAPVADRPALDHPAPAVTAIDQRGTARGPGSGRPGAVSRHRR